VFYVWRVTSLASRQPARATGRRQYRSELRDKRTQETRHAVVEAAHDLFVTNGWAATGMRDVAAAAGVAIETVYSHFSSKRGLLRAVADAAVVGDEAPVPLAERPEFLAIGQGRRAARIRSAAQLLTAVHARTAAVAKLLRQAAPTDEEIAELLATTRERQRTDVAAAIELVVGRPPTPAERDGVWAIASLEVYLLLVEESGWAPAEFEDWITETLERVIPRS
jgi:AcrR family transcriptional regulator